MKATSQNVLCYEKIQDVQFIADEVEFSKLGKMLGLTSDT